MNLKAAMNYMFDGYKVCNTRWETYEYICFDKATSAFKCKKRVISGLSSIDLNKVICDDDWEIYIEKVSFEKALVHMKNGNRAELHNINIGDINTFHYRNGGIYSVSDNPNCATSIVDGRVLFLSEPAMSDNWVLI